MEYQCPTELRKIDDLGGCGAVFESTPDEEGIVDCPVCGMWFTPSVEAPGTMAHDGLYKGRPRPR